MSGSMEGCDVQKYPSILGPMYVGFQDRSRLVVGSTKDYGWEPHRSLAEAGNLTIDGTDCEEHVRYLCEEAGRMWRPSRKWRVDGVQSGVRALTRSGSVGQVPYAGKVCSRHL